MLDLLGWTFLKMEVGNDAIYHEVGVVKDLPVSVLLGGEMMRPTVVVYNMRPQVEIVFISELPLARSARAIFLFSKTNIPLSCPSLIRKHQRLDFKPSVCFHQIE